MPLVEDFVDNGSLSRRIQIVLPEQVDFENCVVVFGTDGQFAEWFAEELNRPPLSYLGIVFVGVDHNPNARAQEYVIGRDDTAFEAHEELFTQTVHNQVTERYGIKPNRSKTFVSGFSCGGSFATSLAIRHPEVYGGAIAMSVAGRPIPMKDSKPIRSDLSNSRFFLLAGIGEMAGMKKYMKKMQRWLESCGADCRYDLVPGGHDIALWSEYYATAICWMLGREDLLRTE